MFEDLKWLVDLQKLDNEIYQLTGEERNTDSFITKKKHEIEELSLNRVKLIRKQREHKEDLEAYQEDITDHKRILSQKEIDLENDKKTKKEHIRREVKKLQKAVEVFNENAEELTAEINRIIEEVSQIDKDIQKIQRKIKTEVKKKNELAGISKQQLEILDKKKLIVEKSIRIPFLNHYKRIMKIRNGIAITFVTEEGLCNGCRIHVPFQLQQKIKLRDDYNICEGCGRILVDAGMILPKSEIRVKAEPAPADNAETKSKAAPKTKPAPKSKAAPKTKPETKTQPESKAKTSKK